MAAIIQSIEAILVDIPTIRPHKLSMTTMGVQTMVIVRIKDSDGLEGLGEATTIGGLAYGPESPESVKLTIDTYFTPLLLSLGLLSVVFVVWLANRMDVVDEESQPIHMTIRLPGYYWWLLVKIVQANIDVVRHIWRPKLTITPGTATLIASQQSDMGKVIYANSITLTPGTVALNVVDNQIEVHALTREGLEELQGGEMDRRVSELE